MRDLVIDKPQALSIGQQIGQRLVTALFWALFLYLLRPLLSVFAWFLGVIRFREVMIVQEGIYDLLHLLKWYFLIVFIMAMAMEGWALYNLVRFRGKDRRRAAAPLGSEAIAAFFRIDLRRLTIWYRSDCLRLRHDETGRILAAEGDDSAGPEPLRLEPISLASPICPDRELPRQAANAPL